MIQLFILPHGKYCANSSVLSKRSNDFLCEKPDIHMAQISKYVQDLCHILEIFRTLVLLG